MDGGCSSFVKDGVEYRLVDHDNIEAFAGRGVYLGVLGDTFYDRKAYNFNKTTGEITRNESYKGINALFKLPLDQSKADEKRQKNCLPNGILETAVKKIQGMKIIRIIKTRKKKLHYQKKMNGTGIK